METAEINKTKRTDLFKIDPRAIIVNKENNIREDYGDMESLKQHIREHGVTNLPPIKVRKQTVEGVEQYQLIHGYRRVTATMELIDEGFDVARLNAITVSSKYKDEDEMLDHLFENSGKNLTPFEEAKIYQLLEKCGYNKSEVARKVSKSTAHVSNMLKVMDAPRSIHKALADGLVTVNTVLLTMSNHPDTYPTLLMGAIAVARKLNKPRATQKHVDAITKGVNPTVRQSKFTKRVSSALQYSLENDNLEQIEKLRKAESIMNIMDTTKNTEEMIEKLCEVL